MKTKIMKPEPKYKKGDTVRLGLSEKSGNICSCNWNKEYTEWEYRITNHLGSFFEYEFNQE
jgi:hypothetical protein